VEAFHNLGLMTAHRRAVIGRISRPAAGFGMDGIIDLSIRSIRKRMMQLGANRTLMLVVEARTPGLPFECA
jgi:hypothetical protein